MNYGQLTPDWEILLEPFQSLFTKPGFRYFRVFVFVFAHLDGRLFVTQVILANLLSRHYTNFYQFLQSKAWSLREVRQKVFACCQQVAVDAQGRLFAAIDDTVAQKTGKHFDAAGWHHDPMNRQHKKQLSYGHCFVCLAVLAQQRLHHWVALFLGCALYVQKSVCAEARPFATKLELAATLLVELVPPSHVMVIAVADGAYAKRAFVQPVCASGRHVLSRLRMDTVFYDLPPARKRLPNGKYRPGKPQKYGAKHKALVWAQTMGTWRPARLCLYGKWTDVEIKTRVVIQRTFGVRIRLVAVRWQDRPLLFLFCTDTTLCAEEIVTTYCARFAIETGFRDSKQSFGMSTYQVRREERFTRLLHLCLWAQTLLRLSLWNARPSPIYGAWRHPLDYLTLAQQKRLSQSQNRVFAGSMQPPTTLENVGNEAVTA
jgi:hypothetical protein